MKNIEMDIDPALKFQMEEEAIKGGQAERYEPRDIDIEAVKAEQQKTIHQRVKEWFTTATLFDIFTVATDNYIKQSAKRLPQKPSKHHKARVLRAKARYA